MMMQVTIGYCCLLAVATAFVTPSTRTASSSSTALYVGDLLNGLNGGSLPTKKKILVLGGDGFCGWPTSLYLSDKGHDVVIVDNLSRRKIDLDLGCDSLTPIQTPEVSNTMLFGYCRFIHMHICQWLAMRIYRWCTCISVANLLSNLPTVIRLYSFFLYPLFLSIYLYLYLPIIHSRYLLFIVTCHLLRFVAAHGKKSRARKSNLSIWTFTKNTTCSSI
jgi:hypothetical protein